MALIYCILESQSIIQIHHSLSTPTKKTVIYIATSKKSAILHKTIYVASTYGPNSETYCKMFRISEKITDPLSFNDANDDYM